MRSRFYDPGLDIVRFIACVFVLIHHVLSRIIGEHSDNFIWQILNNFSLGGGLGVIFFYALSSYLLTKIFLEEQKTGKLSLKKFLVRRQLRIYPLYFFYLALLGILGFFHFPFNCLPPNQGQTASLVLFVYNWIDWLPDTPSSLAAILWSVCVEEQFYLVLVMVVALFGVKKFPAIGIILIALGLFSRAFILFLNLPYPAIWKLTPCHFDSFGVGMIAACIESKLTIPRTFKSPLILLSLTSPALFVARYGMDTYSGGIAIFSYFWCAIMAIGLCWSLSGIVPRGLVARAIVNTAIYWGKRSYGIYVYHWLFLYLVPFAFHPDNPDRLTAIDGFSVVAFTAVTSIVSYRLIERPFLNLKKYFS